jgi:hypothetical protein
MNMFLGRRSELNLDTDGTPFKATQPMKNYVGPVRCMCALSSERSISTALPGTPDTALHDSADAADSIVVHTTAAHVDTFSDLYNSYYLASIQEANRARFPDATIKVWDCECVRAHLGIADCARTQ